MPFDVTKLDTQTVIFGGLTLVSLSLVILVWRIVKQYGNHTNSVIDRNTTAWLEHTKTNQQQIDMLSRLANVIEKFHERI